MTELILQKMNGNRKASENLVSSLEKDRGD